MLSARSADELQAWMAVLMGGASNGKEAPGASGSGRSEQRSDSVASFTSSGPLVEVRGFGNTRTRTPDPNPHDHPNAPPSPRPKP